MPVKKVPWPIAIVPSEPTSDFPPDPDDKENFPPLSLEPRNPKTHHLVIGKTAPYALALKGDGIEEHHTSVGTVKSSLYTRLHGFVYFPLLPVELQAKVYEHAVEEGDYPARCVSRLRYAWEMFPNSMSIKQFDRSYFPNVCKAIPEALPAYLQNMNFIVDNHIHSLKDHSEFLAKVQPIPRGLPSILQLHFTNFASFDGIGAIDEQGHRIATNPSINLMKQFPGLRHLRLTVFGSYALPKIHERGGVKPSKEDVVRDTATFHGLEGLFDCRSLREIVFINREIEEEILQYYFSPDQRSHMNRHMEAIMEWIRVEFKARNSQTVDVRMIRRHDNRVAEFLSGELPIAV